MVSKKNIVAIVQARLGSRRLPNKVIAESVQGPLIGVLLSRLNESELVSKIVVATTESKADDKLVEIVKSIGFDVFRGSEEDVLDRYANAAIQFQGDIIVRITGDCPLIDPKLVDEIIRTYLNGDYDYVSNTIDPTYPDGMDVEVFSLSSLISSRENAGSQYEREHVTPFIKDSGKFRTFNNYNATNESQLRITVDQEEDLSLIRFILQHFKDSPNFNLKDIYSLRDRNSEIFSINKDYTRNEGSKMHSGNKLWKRAKRVIPGGNMLLSKRPEMFHPKNWPTYFSKSRGCHVWDLDGNKYADMSLMGVGTNILGYSHPEVDETVAKVVKDGNMTTLNSVEEIYLAEKLIEMHPWAGMVRFARSGGEANAICVRIARAYARKGKIAICGYHGWHDWYLSVNLAGSDGLAQHLLPGLDPNGVPEQLSQTSVTFEYNNVDQLEELIRNDDISIIKMEVMRNVAPHNNFLQKVRELADKNEILLIFDECTSGFRETFGGLHQKYQVTPDLAVFGKAIGNGYAISAVIGKTKVMQSAQSTFISSTFWTERIGSAAALKTLEVMEREKSWHEITQKGSNIKSQLKKIADKNNLSIDIFGLDAMCSFKFNYDDHLKYKTYLTQEMLKSNILATNSVYSSIAHTEAETGMYLEKLEEIFMQIKNFVDGDDINKSIDGDICHSGFKRLN